MVLRRLACTLVSVNREETQNLLQEERAKLLRRIDELTAGGEVELDYDDDFADRGQVASEQGEHSALADALRQQLTMVEQSLARLADGSYGRCEVCGQAISDARLEALPATSRCIEHAAGPN